MNRQGPRLKNGVDLQLQSAFSDGNWQVAMRLAEKRAKLLNDQYYEVVKICAESQLDDPTAKFAAVSAVWQYAKSGAVIKDVEALELLEWATQHLVSEDDFAETFGQLKVRTAKASPKDRNTVLKCLESCLLHWDLNSAQQIAAILDRSFPAEKNYHFWNIVITHMLSSSPQSPPEKKKLYGTLAQKQIERAAQATEQAEAPTDGTAAAAAAASAASKPPVRRVQTEEETILLYDVVDAHGTAEDFEKLIASAAFSPVSQFRQGRKELLQRAVDKYRRDGNWAAVFQLCKECLSEVDADGQPTLLACDFVTWKNLISAASHQKDANDRGVIDDVRELLSKLLASKNMRSMYRRNILLSRVSAAFELGPSDEEDVIHGEPSSLRLRELLYYINDQSTSVACFNDIKGFLERLDAKGLKYLADEHLPRLSSQSSDKLSAARLSVLSLKVQYFELTSRPKTSSTAAAASFLTCLSQLSKSAVRLYKSMGDEEEGSAMTTEIVPELSILIASCSLTEAFHVQARTKQGTIPASERRHVLQAVVLLEDQLSKNPIHPQISLMLVQLHLFLGSAYRASEIWEAIGVKRTIVDSLAPIFYDRISTISPSLLSPNEEWGEYFRDLLRTHYDASLKLRMPRRLIDAFEAGSYGSVIEIPKYLQDLRASCTRAMSLTESKRAERFLGLTTLDLMTDARYYEVSDDVRLVEQIDYGSFPSWGSNASQPLHLSLRIGPAPSSRRCHLSLLSETFHDVLSYKPPAVYKVPSSSGTDTVFIVEMMNRLSNSFAKFLPGPDSDFTPSEIVYFEALSVLSTLISVYTCPDRQPSSMDGLDELLEALRAALETQRMLAPRYDKGVENIVAAMGSMHGLSMLRDTVVGIKLAAQWMITWNDKEKERDRSGRSGLPKELVGVLKGLHAAAGAAGKEGQAVVASLKGDLLSRDFEASVVKWMLGGEGQGGEDEGVVGILSRDVVSEVVESWVANVKGWGLVKW